MVDLMRKLGSFQVADWLSLAAAPTFASMAALSGILEGDAHRMSCSAAMPMSALTGMIPMYALMCAFHFTPWLKLVSSWRSVAGAGASSVRL